MLKFINSITIRDIMDIVLNSYILFRFYVLFMGTNVLLMIMGIALLWLFRIFAVYMGLIVTSWILQGIMAVAALVVIIVFRDEIRVVLQTKKIKTLFWGIPRKESNTPVEIIVSSVEELAKEKQGALIVIPGKKDPESIIQGGIDWRGLVSRDMILSIFWSGNPVHDGAIIIKGNKVTKVSAILPLTKKIDLPSYYGTRHRAALGLTEHTDALVIIVSEERGKISVAKDAKLDEISDNVDLAKVLHKHLETSSEENGQLKKEKIRIAAAALGSFIIISTIWYSFARGQDTLINMEVPLEYMNRKPGMEMLNSTANTVNLQLGGAGALMRSLSKEQVKVSLDLKNAIAGQNTLTIKKDDVTLPPGVTLNNIEPHSVGVLLDISINKKIPVQADWTGILKQGLIIESADIKPKELTLTGSSSILKNISTIYTEKIALNDISDSGTAEVKPVLNPASLKIEDTSGKIIVNYTVKKRKN